MCVPVKKKGVPWKLCQAFYGGVDLDETVFSGDEDDMVSDNEPQNKYEDIVQEHEKSYEKHCTGIVSKVLHKVAAAAAAVQPPWARL